MGGTFSVIGPKKRVRQPKSRSHSKKHDAIVHYAFEPFGDLIIAYNACKKSIEDVEKLESARTEAELLRATIDEILKRIARHKDEDVKWSDHNAWIELEQAGGPRGGEICMERMRRHIRRLRTLSLKDIDPILNDPSSISKPWSSDSAETKAQWIDQILKQAYDGFIEAFGDLRTARDDALASM